jgi:hypothetical protein
LNYGAFKDTGFMQPKWNNGILDEWNNGQKRITADAFNKGGT